MLILPEHGEYSRTAFQSPEDVCTVPFVSYRSDYPMYRQVSALFDRFQLHPQISHYAYSEDAIAQLVAQELGVSIVAETESLAIYDNIRILRPDWLSDGRYLYLTYHRLRHQGDAVRSMMDFTDRFF